MIDGAGAGRRDDRARARGAFRTPCFMPVGTRGAVQHLAADDLEQLGVAGRAGQHLPPDAAAGRRRGRARSAGCTGSWAGDGHVLTDSGGFQVFSLVAEGRRRRRDVPLDLRRQRRTGSRPSGAVAHPGALGADIQMVLDVCPPLPAPDRRRAASRSSAPRRGRRAPARRAPARRTRRCSGSSRAASTSGCARESAERTVEIGFDGYGIGGLSVGETRDEMLPALAAATAELPADRPRYLMGVGDPVSLVEAVALGVDMFDCVLPTRLGPPRHGAHRRGPAQPAQRPLRAATTARSTSRARAPCRRRWSRGYLRHLLSGRRAHGGAACSPSTTSPGSLRFVDRMRTSIVDGTFEAFRAAVRTTWAA